MPNYVPPGNDTARVAFLNNTLGAAKSDISSGNNYVMEETFKKIKQFTPGFEKKVTTVNQNLSSRSKEIEERNSSLDILSVFVRDGFEIARRQVNRLGLPSHVLTLYGLPLDGLTPKPTTAVEWLTIAKTFLEGAGKVEEQGHPVVTCPSPDEIVKVLRKAEKEYEEVASADRSYDEAQAGIADMRKKADELIDDIMAELRFSLRKLETPSQRRIMRSYGARYKYLKGEKVDPDDNEPIVDEVSDEVTEETVS